MSTVSPEQVRQALSRLLETTEGRTLEAYLQGEYERAMGFLLKAPVAELVSAQQSANALAKLVRLFDESRGIR